MYCCRLRKKAVCWAAMHGTGSFGMWYTRCIKAERRLGRLEMDVRLAEHGLTALPQPAPEQPKQETVRDVADWLEASEKGGGETGMAQVREYILDFWKCAGE